MKVHAADLVISATKPRGKPAALLAQAGVAVLAQANAVPQLALALLR